MVSYRVGMVPMPIGARCARAVVFCGAFLFAYSAHAAPPLPTLTTEAQQKLNACVADASTTFLDAQARYPEYQKFQDGFIECNTRAQSDIASCYGEVSVRYQRWQETIPEFKEYQRQSLLCYVGTPYEVLLPPCARPGATVQCPDPIAARNYLDELGYSPYLEQAAKTQTALTAEQSQKLVACLWDTTWRAVERNQRASEKVYEEYAACYTGLPGFEGVVATHTYSVNVVACARTLYGGSYLGSLAERGALPSAEETATLKKCAEAAAIGSVTVAAVNTFFGVGPVNLLLYAQLLLTQPLMFVEMRRRRRWGQVLHALLHTPIDLAVVRLFEGGKLARTRVTDKQGRYLFLVDAGTYTLEANRHGFRFPVTIAIEGYRGGALTVKHEEIIRERIPLEPALHDKLSQRAWWRRAGIVAYRWISIVAPTLGIAAFIVSPTWWVGALAVAQILLYLLVRRLSARRPKKYGVVQNARGTPVAGAVVRIFALPWNKLAETQLTNRKGRYAFLVGPGAYTITAEQAGIGRAEHKGIVVKEGETHTVLGPKIVLEQGARKLPAD